MGKMIGIDLGRPILASRSWRRQAQVIENSEGDRTTPSIVASPRTARCWWAVRQAPGRDQPGEHVAAVKRLIGRKFTDDV